MNFVIVSDSRFAPELMPLDVCCYEEYRTVEPNIGDYVVYFKEDSNRAMLDKVMHRTEFDVMLHSGDTIPTGELAGVIAEVHRPFKLATELITTMAERMNSYHSRHHDTTFNDVCKGVDDLIAEAMDNDR